MTNRLNKSVKRNKYKLIITLLAIIFTILIVNIIRNQSREAEIAKYNDEILIVKAGGDQLDSMTLGEIRNMGAVKKTVALNNGLEKVDIEGVAIEKIIGNLNYSLRNKAAIVVEDNDGKSKRIPMSLALEPERFYLVFKINDTPLFDLSPAYGKFTIIDTTSDSSSSWISNVKTLDIQ